MRATVPSKDVLPEASTSKRNQASIKELPTRTDLLRDLNLELNGRSIKLDLSIEKLTYLKDNPSIVKEVLENSNNLKQLKANINKAFQKSKNELVEQLTTLTTTYYIKRLVTDPIEVIKQSTSGYLSILKSRINFIKFWQGEYNKIDIETKGMTANDIKLIKNEFEFYGDSMSMDIKTMLDLMTPAKRQQVLDNPSSLVRSDVDPNLLRLIAKELRIDAFSTIKDNFIIEMQTFDNFKNPMIEFYTTKSHYTQ